MYIKCLDCGQIYERPVDKWEKLYGPVEGFVCKKCVRLHECDEDGYLADGGQEFNSID